MSRRLNWFIATLLTAALCLNVLTPLAMAEDVSAISAVATEETSETPVSETKKTNESSNSETDKPKAEVSSESVSDSAKTEDASEAVVPEPEGKNESTAPEADQPSESVSSPAEPDQTGDAIVSEPKGKGESNTSKEDDPKAIASSKPKITSEPEDVVCAPDTKVTLKVTAEGTGLTYQWQYSDDQGKTWKASSVTSNVYSTTVSLARNGRLLRCVVTDASGNQAISRSILLTVSTGGPKITSEPEDVVCAPDTKVTLKVTAEGTGLTYQWQYSDDQGKTWKAASSTSNTYSTTVSQARNGRLLRCVVTDASGNQAISRSILLTVVDVEEIIQIIQQPQDWTSWIDGMAYFSVVAIGNGLTYQWQFSDNNGVSWTDSSGSTGAVYSTSATKNRDGRLIRCILTDEDGNTVTTRIAVLHVTSKFEITQQPTNISGELSATATFVIQVGGENVKYRWETSADGVNGWQTVSDTATATATRLNQSITPSRIGKYYRCIVTNGDGSTLTSDVVRLTLSLFGFFDYGNSRYYSGEDGTLATGLQTISGKIYLFTDSGVMRYGMCLYNDKRYYFQDDGSAYKGFFTTNLEKVGRCTFYFGEDGAAYTGWNTIDGKKYYFYPSNGIMVHGLTQIGAYEYYFDDKTGALTYGLVQVGMNNYMYFEEGANLPSTGLRTVNGALYYFSSEAASYGVAESGLQKINDETYYFDPTTKRACSGWVETNGSRYYFNDDYKMLLGLQKIKGSLYNLGSTGAMQYGMATINSNRYFFDEKSGEAIVGWYNDGVDQYYFDEKTFAAVTGVRDIDGATYYFTSSGRQRTGLIWANNKYYYFAEEGEESGSGFKTINGKTYYFYEDHTAAVGLQEIANDLYYFSDYGTMLTGMRTLKNVRYYFSPEDGKAVTGFVTMENGNTYYFAGAKGTLSGLQQINKKWYYFSSTTPGLIVTGRNKIGDDYYFFDLNTGEAISGWSVYTATSGNVYRVYYDPDTFTSVKGLREIAGKLYYFNDNGYVATGKISIGDSTYHFDTVTGVGTKLEGTTAPGKAANAATWGTINGHKCYYNYSGQPSTGLIVIDKELYFFNDSGEMQTGWQTVGDKTYYFDIKEDGTAAALSGPQEIGGESYYFNTSNYELLTGIHKMDGITHYYDDDGKKVTGWIVIGNSHYYLDEAKGILTGLQTIDGNVYWLGDSGARATGVQSVTDADGNEMTCLFDVDGVMVKGLYTDASGQKYYYDKETGARQTGTMILDNAEYYFDPTSGAAATGLKDIDGVYRYYDLETKQRVFGFQKFNGKIYYLTDKDDGLTHGLVTLDDGNTYYFNETTGAARTGYYNINNVRYYFDPKTGASISGVYTATNGKTYGFLAGGGTATGLYEFDGKQYYFYPDSARMAEGLVSVGDKLHYFTLEEGMVKNREISFAGITYSIDAEGSVTVVGDGVIEQIIRAGIERLGKPYGSDELAPDLGDASSYNCSQLVSAVLREAGFDVRTSAYLQYYSLLNDGYEIEVITDYSQAKPGDIIYFCIPECKYGDACEFWNELHHVGIYMGDGKILESTEGAREGVLIQDFEDGSIRFTYAIIRLKGMGTAGK